MGGVFYLVYLALEPFVRRSWPTMLVGWSRALSGRVPDPVVGRDLIVGVVAGLVSLHRTAGHNGAADPRLARSADPGNAETRRFEHTRYLVLMISGSLNNGLQNALLSVMAFTGSFASS